MRTHALRLSVSSDARVPLFRRLAQALVQAMEDGRLQPGEALPGSRALAELVGANRKTVVEALQELEAEGWVVCEPSRGTFVSQELPRWSAPVEAPRPAVPMGFDLPAGLDPLSAQVPGALFLAEGLPDPGMAPAEALAKGYQRALRRHGEALLGRGAPQGTPLLRETLAAWLAGRSGHPIHAGEVLITRGGAAAVALLGLALLTPGDAVAVEQPGCRATWDALAQRGNIQLVPVRVDEGGLDPDDLERVLALQPLRALCLSPRCQHPTTARLSAPRRARILELSRRHRFALIEEDHDAEQAWGEPMVLPLGAEDPGGQVIRIVCFSRLLAQGVRLGCLVAPAALIERLARLQRSLEWQGDPVLEWAMADLIRDGDLDRLLRRTRATLHQRMAHLADGLERRFGAHLQVIRPAAGLSLWMEPRGELELEPWTHAARLEGVVLHAPRHHWLEGPGSGLRMGFAQHAPEVLDEALARLARAWARVVR